MTTPSTPMDNVLFGENAELVEQLLSAAGLGPAHGAVDASEQRGIFSTVLRLDLGDARSVIAKLPGPNREAAIASGAFDREAIAYEQVTPRSPIKTPECLAIVKQADGAAAFLLEDLSNHRRVDQQDGLSADDLLIAADTLGLLHRWWKSRPEIWPAVRHHAPTAFGDEALAAGLNTVEQTWAAVADPAPLARLLQQRAQRTEQFVAAPPTLCHGDPRADNMVFDGAHAVLFDWQQIALQLGAADLAWLMATSVSSEVRRRSEDAVLAHYAEAVGQSADETTEHYRRAALLPGLAVLLLAQRELTNDHARQTVRVSVQRISDFVADAVGD